LAVCAWRIEDARLVGDVDLVTRHAQASFPLVSVLPESPPGNSPLRIAFVTGRIFVKSSTAAPKSRAYDSPMRIEPMVPGFLLNQTR